MTALVSLLSDPRVWIALGAYYVYSAMVDALPAPNGSKGYLFLYKFCHALAGNLKRAATARVC